MNQSKNINLIRQLKQNINSSISLVNQHKDNIRVNQRYELLNYLEYINNLLNEMMPQEKPFDNNKFELTRNMGDLTRSINKGNKAEWETQFDESLNLNPPCYLMPPQNMYSLNKLKKQNNF